MFFFFLTKGNFSAKKDRNDFFQSVEKNEFLCLAKDKINIAQMSILLGLRQLPLAQTSYISVLLRQLSEQKSDYDYLEDSSN